MLDKTGVAAIEFALLAVPFFAVFLAIVETSILFMGELTLDRVVEQVGRQVRTGEIDSESLSKEDFAARVCDGVDILMDCSKLRIDLRTYASFAAIQTDPPSAEGGGNDYSGFGYERGGPDRIMALRVFYEWPVLTDVMRKAVAAPDGNFVMVGMSAFRTEGYR